MPRLSRLVSAEAYRNLARRWTGRPYPPIDDENERAILSFPPGHFYSPLLDVRTLREENAVPFDGPEMWEHVDLRPTQQQELYTRLLAEHPPLPFPRRKTEGSRYYVENAFFCEADAFTLSAILRHQRPRRVVEVGSGFSSAVMLDTLSHMKDRPELVFIEPYPERLYALLAGDDKTRTEIFEKPVQEVPLEVFDKLQAGDVLFIDSSHIAKVGSDVTFLLLRILPRLAPGVWVHVHDIFYPSTYPTAWLKQGRAWNEGLFLRAYLIGNKHLQLAAFNCYAARTFPHIFKKTFPAFLENSGGSLWMQTVA